MLMSNSDIEMLLELLMPLIHARFKKQIDRHANINPHFNKNEVLEIAVFEEINSRIPSATKELRSCIKDCYVDWTKKHKADK